MKPSADLIELHDYEPSTDDLREAVLDGLKRPQKTLPAKFLYDQPGSRLFDQVTELEEYYPTRTEAAIMRKHAGQIAAALGPQCVIIEYGSGSGVKTRRLLSTLHAPAAYVPIEISREHLIDAALQLAAEFPDTPVIPVCADFTAPLQISESQLPCGRRIVFFPGSTIGNFTPEQAVRCLKGMADLCRDGGGVLIGVDLDKDPRVLKPAYDDAKGVTAAFNLNILRRINRELGADFDLHAFEHVAIHNRSQYRMEMHLRSTGRQDVTINGDRIRFREGETIHTESSHKYTLARFQEMTAESGLRVERVWTDDRDWFSVQYLTVA